MVYLLPLGPLSTNIEHVDTELTHVEPGLRDTSRLGTSAQDVGFIRDVVWQGDTSDMGKEAVHAEFVSDFRQNCLRRSTTD